MKCKDCIYFEEPTIHGHGEFWGYCKIIERLSKHYNKEIDKYNEELEKRLKGFFTDNEILNLQISYYSGTKEYDSNCTINEFTKIINKTLKTNKINYELRNNLMIRNINNNSINTKYPGYKEDLETYRKRLIKKTNIIKYLFTILETLSYNIQLQHNQKQEDFNDKNYKYKDTNYYIIEDYFEIADFLIENDYRLR